MNQSPYPFLTLIGPPGGGSAAEGGHAAPGAVRGVRAAGVVGEGVPDVDGIARRRDRGSGHHSAAAVRRRPVGTATHHPALRTAVRKAGTGRRRYRTADDANATVFADVAADRGGGVSFCLPRGILPLADAAGDGYVDAVDASRSRRSSVSWNPGWRR